MNSLSALLVLARVVHAPVDAVVGPHGVWGRWSATPLELLLIIAPAFWYASGAHALWRAAGHGRGVSRAQVGAFAVGLVVVALALMSPLDAAADALFSAHMVQHLLLIVVAAPLCVAGVPIVAMVWALPTRTRRALGPWWVRQTIVRRVMHGLTAPGVAFATHSMVLWFWHFPVPYEVALAHPAVHALEHLSFFGTALLFWWVIAQPVGRRRVTPGAALLLLAGILMQGGALGALLIFSPTPWYPAHAAGAYAWGTTLLHDQQLAGLIMWIPASVVYIGTAAWLFVKWMQADARSALPPRRSRVTPSQRLLENSP